LGKVLPFRLTEARLSSRTSSKTLTKSFTLITNNFITIRAINKIFTLF
jgi:hypothetical protein